MKVKIESSKLIKPLYQGNSPITSDRVPLSVFDKVTYNQHIAVIYAYHPPTQSNSAIELGLRKALSEYPEWAGRLRKDRGGNPIVLLNDEGVRFVEACVDQVLDRMMLVKPSPDLLSLHPNLEGVEELVQVQLTRFSCGSMVVGFTAHHHVADGHSSSNFLVAWGQATRGVRISPLPLRDRSIFPPRSLPKIEFEHRGAEYVAKKFKKTYPLIDYDANDIMVHKVHYTKEFIAKIKAKASNTSGKRFTTIESLLAHLWRTITRARGLNESETTKIRISVDGRSRLNPKVPNEYFGNLVLWAFATSKVKDLVHEPLSYTAKLLHDAVTKVNDNYFKSFIDFTNHEMNEEELVPNTESNETILWPDLEVDSWLRFPFYDLDFGHGEPYIFMPSFFPVEGMVLLLPSFSGDGSIEVFVPLFQQSLTTFKEICYSLD